MTQGELLSALLKKNRVTVPELASILNKNRGTIYSYLYDKTSMSLETVIIISRKLNVSLEYWIDGDSIDDLVLTQNQDKRRLEFILAYFLSNSIDKAEDEAQHNLDISTNMYDHPTVMKLTRIFNLWNNSNRQ